MYVVGGMGRFDDLASVEVFDPISDKWSKYPHEAAEICGIVQLISL